MPPSVGLSSPRVTDVRIKANASAELDQLCIFLNLITIICQNFGCRAALTVLIILISPSLSASTHTHTHTHRSKQAQLLNTLTHTELIPPNLLLCAVTVPCCGGTRTFSFSPDAVFVLAGCTRPWVGSTMHGLGAQVHGAPHFPHRRAQYEITEHWGSMAL